MRETSEGTGPDRDADERRYHDLLFERHPDPLYWLDGAGRFAGCNTAFETISGYQEAELLALPRAPFVHPDDAERVHGEFLQALAGERRRFEARGIARDGTPIIVDVTYLPVAAHDEVVRVYGIARDISGRVAAQRALEASERRFRGLFEGAGSGIAITSRDGTFVDANPAFLAMLGYTLDELRELDVPALTHPDDRRDAGRFDALFAGEATSFVLERRWLTRVGGTVWTRTTVSPIHGADGAPTHVALTAEDVTEVRSATERLRRSESLRRLAGDLARVGGWAVEADGNVSWSEEVYRILDAPDGDEPPLDVVLQRYPPTARARLEQALEACFAIGEPFDLELELDTFAGTRLPVRIIAEPQRDEAGAVVRVFGAIQDLSDLREATERAEAAAARLTTTLESMTDAFFTLDREWRFTFLNARAGELLHRNPGALLGRSMWEEFSDAVGSEAYHAYHRAMHGEGTQVIEAFWYEPLATYFAIHAYPSEQGLAVYFRDVTESRAAIRELEQREAVLRRQAELLDEAQDAILVRDATHRITYWSRGAERVYGWRSDEAVGADIRGLLYDDPSLFDTATAEVFAEGSWSGEIVQRNRQGEQVVVAARWTLVRDEHGRPDAVLAINTDITERQRIEQQLLRAQRMESIGTLAGGVAHDLNNVLSPILLATELLRLQTDDSGHVDLLDTIASSAQRGADLVTQVLSFARGVEGQRAPVDVAALLRDIRAIVRDTFPKDIALRVVASEQTRSLVGDSTQIQQVLLNLAVNARDAMPDGGELTIRSSEVDLDEQYAAATPGTTPGPYLLIEVEDSGTGMTAEVRDRVFEPFFTTKPQGAGTGLGLSTSAAIVRSHGGFLRVYSEPGRGSRFRMYLPLDTSTGDRSAPVAALPDPLRGRGQTVLVVDDEAAVRAMTRQTLEAHGYRAMEAANGAEAVSIYAQHRDEIDVVLTDMMMPIMDGPAAIHALKNLDAAVRIIGASGLHGNGKVAKAATAGVEHFLPKPYTSRGLLDALATILPPET